MSGPEIMDYLQAFMDDNKGVFLTVLGIVAGLSVGIMLVRSAVSRVVRDLGMNASWDGRDEDGYDDFNEGMDRDERHRRRDAMDVYNNRGGSYGADGKWQ